MEDLIYNFLLQSGYPRASILMDTNSFSLTNKTTGEKLPNTTFVIVDPTTVAPLAVVQVEGPIDDKTLHAASVKTRRYAAALGSKSLQGYVIRVDIRAAREAEQVKFYRVWPNKSLQSLTSKTFPDLDSLRVARKIFESSIDKTPRDTAKLSQSAASIAVPNKASGSASHSAPMQMPSSIPKPGLSLYIPALLLLAMFLLDSIVDVIRGAPLLTLAQSVLLIGVAILLTVPAALRYLR